MRITLRTVLLVIALVCFALAALEFVPRRFNLVAAGLALWVASELVT